MCLGVPGQIVAISDPQQLLGIVSVSGVRREVHLACIVDEAHPVAACLGDWVLVHVGFAMSRIDEAEAAATLRLLTELGEMQAELEALQQDGKAGDHGDDGARPEPVAPALGTLSLP